MTSTDGYDDEGEDSAPLLDWMEDETRDDDGYTDDSDDDMDDDVDDNEIDDDDIDSLPT